MRVSGAVYDFDSLVKKAENSLTVDGGGEGGGVDRPY